MKIKVIREFIDKTNNEQLVRVDAIMDVTNERGNRLISVGVAEPIEDYTATVYENKRNKKSWGVQDGEQQ